MMKKVVSGMIALGLVMGSLAMVLGEEKKEEPKYEGSKKCQQCHDEWYLDFQKTKMSKCFDILKPNERAEAKVKAKKDPAKDYSQDESCLECHTGGYGEKGGFIPLQKLAKITDKALLKEAEKRNVERQGIECESCHGPGSEFTKIMKEVKENKKAEPDTEKKLVAAGLILPGRTDVIKDKNNLVCYNCHNKKDPFHKEFIPEERLGKADGSFHKHHKLKYIQHVYPVIIEPKKVK